MGSASRLICAALISGALLVGCTASPATSPRLPTAESSARQAHSWMLPEASRDNLLYVSDTNSQNVMVYTYFRSALRLAGILTGPPQPMGECVDARQNVWVTGGTDFESFVMYLYAHGATSPSAVLRDPVGTPIGCAVHSANGDLAVVSANTNGSNLPVAIYKDVRGKLTKPTTYSYPTLYPKYLTYDGKRNLFVVGEDNDDALTLVELPRGGNALIPITVTQRFQATGGIAWDGSDLAIADAGAATIYRFKLTGSTAKEVGSLSVAGANTIEQLTVEGNRVLVPSYVAQHPGAVSIYHYPAGGDRIRTLRNFSLPYAAVVSRGSKE